MINEISNWYYLGVNGKKWKTRAQFEDLFFAEYQLKPGVFSIETSLINSLDFWQQKEIVYLHLNSQQSRYYYYTLKSKNINFLEFGYTKPVGELNNIYNSKISAALQICQSENKPVFFPFGNVRLLNINFLTLNQGYDLPYFVFIEDEDYLEAEIFIQNNKLRAVVNPLRLSSDVFSSFFLSDKNRDWMSAGTTTFHNYNIEEKIFEDVSDKLKYPTLCEYQESFKNEISAFENVSNYKNTFRKFPNQNSREATCPVHIFLKKYFNIDANINTWAKEVYGS